METTFFNFNFSFWLIILLVHASTRSDDETLFSVERKKGEAAVGFAVCVGLSSISVYILKYEM